MRVRKYRTTDAFGDSEVGEIRDVLVVPSDGPSFLVFHPGSRGYCASMEMCKESDDGILESSHKDVWVNIDNRLAAYSALMEIARTIRPRKRRKR